MDKVINDTDRREYHKNYYQTILKDKIKDVKVHCPYCNETYKGWNMYKHRQSKKHKINTMTDEEKNLYEKEKYKKMLEKRMDKLNKKYTLECLGEI